MLLLALLASTSSPAAVAPASQATAVVRIVRGARGSAEEWRRLPAPRRRELRRRDELGRELRLRLVEHE